MVATTEEVTIVPDYAYAEKQAQALLDKFGVRSVPVNPIQIAYDLKYAVNAAVFSDPNQSGRILVRSGNVRIDVNARDAVTRRRFTIAHEIGHAVLHLDGVESGEISDSAAQFNRVATLNPREPREAEADRFAAVLLMPEALVREQFENVQDIDTLAKMFVVSNEAMKIRLQQLHLA